ncbi:GNAT superfamily N-acetyltransferase [Saonia flava]|uniref:GNAT superfamily N-acetyltransferase n=1 Tax=Saonia flava TaxID=523696 RepID=A0A846QS33_9FLAO|nr:GNAT family N-acetyltransferase [Saonia flava]NJB69780.1 GNAT superfamily N-acetyltransferase [Saonia flava]
MESNFRVELIPHNQMESILPLVVLLNGGKIPMNVLTERLKNILAMEGYECIGVYDKDKLIGICGIWVLNKLYAGKHVEPDNVFVMPEYRSKGIGQLMMDWLFKYAKEIGCDATEVNCYVKNEKGKRFWERQGYEPVGYHLIKKFE